MTSKQTLRSLLLATAAGLALAACSDTDISSPGAVASPPPPPPPPPAATTVSLVPDNFDDSSESLNVATVTGPSGSLYEVVEVTGPINENLTFEDGVGYYITDSVFIGEDAGAASAKTGGAAVSQKVDAEVTFEPGATVYFSGSNAGIIVTRGSKIIADGNENAPIVFTSLNELERQQGNLEANPNARGEWLGLVINGFAPINNCNDDAATPGTADCEDDGEAASGLYGGDDATDNSGILDYVRVEHAGVFYTDEDQSNGIAFQGVGSGTQVTNIQVHNNGDDGVEFFGGTVGAENVVITGASDDSVDWTDGWTGSIKRLLVVQANDLADYAIEADNRSRSAPDTTPRSNPTITNFTFIGSGLEGDHGIRLREGTGVTLVNGIVSGFEDGFRFGDTPTRDLLTASTPTTTIASVLMNNDEDFPAVTDEGTDEDSTADDVEITFSSFASALQNVEAGFAEIAPTYSFVPGLETSNVSLLNEDGDPLFELLTDPIGLFETGTNAAVTVPLGLVPGDLISSSQVSDFADEIETQNDLDKADTTDDITFGPPETETQTAGVPVFELTGDVEELPYIGAFSPTETVAENWAAGWTKPGTVFAEDTTPPSCPIGTFIDGTLGDNLVCAITGVLETDVTLTNQNNILYRFDGQVFVGVDSGADPSAPATGGKPVTLTIEPGVTAFGNTPNDGLVITRGSTLEAAGTAANPIVLTSGAAVRGTANYATDTAQWLGLSINGRAPINNCNTDSATPGAVNCQDDGEASSGLYGGATVDDNSGTIQYLRLEFSGIFFTEEDQSNGIAFQGVGSGTTVDHIQVHNNGDDGVEFFGGTVDAKHVVITGANDDAVDWTDGWKGRVQYLIVEASGVDNDYGFEGDNRSTSAPDTTPRSTPRIANYSIIGNGSNPGARFREGMGGAFYNGIIVNTTKGFDIDDRSNDLLLGTGVAPADGAELEINGVFLDTAENIDDDDANVAAVVAAITNLEQGTSTMNGFSFYGSNTIGVEPGVNESNATAANTTALNETGEDFFEAAPYLGAVQNGSDTWYLGWTVNSDGDVTSAN